VAILKVVDEGVEVVQLQATACVVPALRRVRVSAGVSSGRMVAYLLVGLLDGLECVLDDVSVAFDGRRDALKLGVVGAVGASSATA
jgi:hypothetical protein